VTPVNDVRPVFTSSDVASISENTTYVMTVAATDADLPAQTVTFSIVGGADQAKFEITSGGVLSFNSAPDFEAPADANQDNVYVLIVQASDGTLTEFQVVLVTVANVSEPLGDYNFNGIVDVGDYNKWRNSLGAVVPAFSGADGSGNGIIDKDDYRVWKANFGNTLLGGGGGASLSSDLSPVVGPSDSPEPVRAEAATTATTPDANTSRPKLLSTVANTNPHRQRNDDRRRTRRGVALAAAAQDDALVAWLASHLDHLRRDSAVANHAEILHEPDRHDSPSPFIDSLDNAFESLGV
jgi:hypothetical protein